MISVRLVGKRLATPRPDRRAPEIKKVCFLRILEAYYSELTLLKTFTRITFVTDSKAGEERLTNRNGSVWKIKSENRTDAGVAINFDASLVRFDHGFDQT